MEYGKQYKVCQGVTRQMILRQGFGYGLTKKVPIYNGFFELKMFFEEDKDEGLLFYYEVLNAADGKRFLGYYYAPYGNSLYLNEVRKEVQAELNKLVSKHIIEEEKGE